MVDLFGRSAPGPPEDALGDDVALYVGGAAVGRM